MKPSAEVSGTASVTARAVTAAATACSEACSTEPAKRSRSVRLVPGTGWTAVTVIWPVVTVPVLSRTTVPIAREDSSAW